MKRIKSRVTGRQACIYRGGNKTYTLMYETIVQNNISVCITLGRKNPALTM